MRKHADSEGTDQPMSSHYMIKAIAVCSQNHRTLQNVSMESKSKNEILRMRGINLNMRILRMFEDTFSLDADTFIIMAVCVAS